MHSPRLARVALSTAAVLGTAFVAVPAAGASVRHAPRFGKGHGTGTSTNWSGYAVDGSNATNVVGTWTVPSVTCAPGENSWSSPWVGIDGDTSNTVEQTGTDSDCVNGSPEYYAWYEMYPKFAYLVPITVNARDSITGQVTYTGGAFVLSLTDNSTGGHFSITQTSKKARRSSIEWIEEGPVGGLLSDFGSVSFTGASGTINNQTDPIGSFSGLNSIEMVTSSGAPRAVPSGVTGSGFSVKWEHS